jgi:hypothetical protein
MNFWGNVCWVRVYAAEWICALLGLVYVILGDFSVGALARLGDSIFCPSYCILFINSQSDSVALILNT